MVTKINDKKIISKFVINNCVICDKEFAFKDILLECINCKSEYHKDCLYEKNCQKCNKILRKIENNMINMNIEI